MRVSAVAVLFLVACHVGATEPGTDGPGSNGDSGSGSLGVFVSWNAHLPGPIDDKLGVTDATFQLAHLQIVGDAAPGDSRTTHSKYLLKWDASAVPSEDAFPDAPPGLYSKVTLDMNGNIFDYAYEIHGTWTNSSNEVKLFKIHDRAPIQISIDCEKMLSAAGAATIPIKVDLHDAIATIDFKSLSVDDGASELSTTDPQIILFRFNLYNAFRVEDH